MTRSCADMVATSPEMHPDGVSHSEFLGLGPGAAAMSPPFARP